jgi:hypothetical protein
LKLENLELFDLVAQELYRLHPATIHTKTNNTICNPGTKTSTEECAQLRLRSDTDEAGSMASLRGQKVSAQRRNRRGGEPDSAEERRGQAKNDARPWRRRKPSDSVT